MKKIDWKTVAIAGLVAFIVVSAGQGSDAAFARWSGADSNGDMIAVTGEYGNGTSVLYVIDTKAKQLAVYRSPNGSHVQLVGARRIEHDLKLVSYQDSTAEGFDPVTLKKNYARFRESHASPTPPTSVPAPPVKEEKK